MGEKQVEIVVKDYLRTLRNNKIAVERGNFVRFTGCRYGQSR
jgi:hypothetical protein